MGRRDSECSCMAGDSRGPGAKRSPTATLEGSPRASDKAAAREDWPGDIIESRRATWIGRRRGRPPSILAEERGRRRRLPGGSRPGLPSQDGPGRGLRNPLVATDVEMAPALAAGPAGAASPEPGELPPAS